MSLPQFFGNIIEMVFLLIALIYFVKYKNGNTKYLLLYAILTVMFDQILSHWVLRNFTPSEDDWFWNLARIFNQVFLPIILILYINKVKTRKLGWFFLIVLIMNYIYIGVIRMEFIDGKMPLALSIGHFLVGAISILFITDLFQSNLDIKLFDYLAFWIFLAVFTSEVIVSPLRAYTDSFELHGFVKAFKDSVFLLKYIIISIGIIWHQRIYN